MAFVRTLVVLVLFLVSPAPSSAQNGGLDDPCDGGPLETRSILRCRDGDPTCDMDGMCDGTCVVRSCLIYPENPASCLVTTRFCSRTAYVSVAALSLIPVGAKQTSRVHATIVGAVCKPARRKCVPPVLPPCRVEVTGDVTASWSCQGRLIATKSDRARPEAYVVRLSEIGGPRLLEVVVAAGIPAPGTFTSDLRDRGVEFMTVTTDSDSIHADNLDPLRSRSLDASLTLATVGASKTPHHEVRGTFDATAVGYSTTDRNARPAVVVHAEF